MKNYILGIVTGIAVIVAAMSFVQIRSVDEKADRGLEAYNYLIQLNASQQATTEVKE